MSMRPLGRLVFVAFALLATKAMSQATTPSSDALFFSCDARAEAFALAMFNQGDSSPEAKAAGMEQAKNAIGRATALREAVLSGQDVEEPYGAAANMARLAKASTLPRTAELFRRAARDQLTRSHFTAASRRISWAAGLADDSRAYAYRIIARDGCGVDQENIAWIKADLRANGWFTIDKFGKDAEQAAFLLVQHADKDREFQREVLAILEPLAATGQTRPASYAYLFDRVALASQKSQRYGTQGRCVETGRWEPFDVETPDELDRRRATVGLPAEAEYKARLLKVCGGG